jgi:preprotein translocase subunit SecG
MLALLVLLIAIYLTLGTGRTATDSAQRWLVRVPFSIYLGWITVATVANATSLFSYWGWGNGLDRTSAIWAAIMLVVATVIAVLMSLRHGDIAYIAVIVWAFAGIAVKHSGNALVSTTAWVMAAIAALSLIIGVPQARKRMQT